MTDEIRFGAIVHSERKGVQAFWELPRLPMLGVDQQFGIVS